MIEHNKKEIGPDGLPIRLYELKLPYVLLLERILKVYPPDLALIYELVQAKKDNKKRVSVPFGDFHRKTSWYKTIIRLSKQNIGLLELKTNKKYTRYVLLSEISFTPLWWKVIEEWRDSVLFQFLGSVPSEHFKTPQHYITHVLPNLLFRPDQKIRQIGLSNIKNKNRVKTIEFKELSLEFEVKNSYFVSNKESEVIYKNGQCVFKCKNCNRSSKFSIKHETYLKYKNSGRKYKRGCRYCVFPNKRTKFVVDFQKETIAIERYYTDSDLKLINPASSEKFEELTEEQKEKIKFIYSPDYKQISIDFIYQILLKHEANKDFKFDVQTLKNDVAELYEGVIRKLLSILAVINNKMNVFSNFIEENEDILLKGVINLLDQKLIREVDSITKQNWLKETKYLIQNYLDEKKVERQAHDNFLREVPLIFKEFTEEVIRYVVKEGIEVDLESISLTSYDLASKSLIDAYSSRFKDVKNKNLFKETFNDAIKSINIIEISIKITEILDFGTLFYNSITQNINLSYFSNKCELDEELIVQRIFNDFDKLLDDLFPNYQDKDFLKEKLKIAVDLELPNQISLAQEALDISIEKKLKAIDLYVSKKLNRLIKKHKLVQDALLARKETIVSSIKSYPVFFQDILGETIHEKFLLGKKKLEKKEIVRSLTRRFRVYTNQCRFSTRILYRKFFKTYVNESLDISENIKLSDLRKYKENFNPSSKLNEQIVLSLIKEFEESELIKRAQIPESSEKEWESLNVSEIKALLKKISEGNYNRRYFIESSALLQSFKNYRESLEEFNVCKFFSACSSIAKDFLAYSKWLKLANLFRSWDEQFAEEFSKKAPRLLNSLFLRKKRNYIGDYKDLRRKLSELNAEKCGCCVRYSDLIFEAIKDAVERKIEVVELRTVVRIALEAVESTQEKLYILNNLYKTLRKAYSNSDGDLTLTKSSKRLYNIWHKF